MNPKALQWASVDITRMDNATFLSFCNNVDEKCQAENAAQMRTTMGQFYADFHTAAAQYDQVFSPARKSLDTEDLKNLDTERDNALGAYHEAVLGLQRNPNEAKRQAARLLNLNFDTYKPGPSQEYMKETELIQQMTADIRGSQELTAAVTLLGLLAVNAVVEHYRQILARKGVTTGTTTGGGTGGGTTDPGTDPGTTTDPETPGTGGGGSTDPDPENPGTGGGGSTDPGTTTDPSQGGGGSTDPEPDPDGGSDSDE